MIDILGTLDAKIENLEKTNVKIQELCLAQYRLIFDGIPKTNLSSIATITMGQSPSGNSLNTDNGTVFYQGRTDFGFRVPSVRLYTTEPNRMAKANDILLSVRAPVGDINIAIERCCIGRGIAAISSSYNSFVYYALLNQRSDFDVYNTAGTIFGSINRDALNAFQVPASQLSLIDDFTSFAKPFDEKILLNTKEIMRLKDLKNNYLQKFFG